MSWVRWGSRCWETFPFQNQEDVDCGEKCPGSVLYIYEFDTDKFHCACCDDVKDFIGTEEQMAKHLLEHDKKGHHTRRSLITWAKKFLKGEKIPWER